MPIYLIMCSLGYSGYYGPIEQVVSAHSTKELAEQALKDKIAKDKADFQRYLDEKYDGGVDYPEICGSYAGAMEQMELIGTNLSISEIRMD